MRANSNMKILYALVVLFFIPGKNLFAQDVFSVEYGYQADVKVYVVEHDYQADLLVYKVDHSYQADGNQGKWYFTKHDYQADKKIYFVDHDYQADLLICFVDNSYQAGWKEMGKYHLME